MTETKQNQKPVLEELSLLRAKVAELEHRLAQATTYSPITYSPTAPKDLQFYQTLLQNLPNGFIFVFDQDLRYVLAEGASLQTPKENIEGKLLQELVSPQNYDRIAYHYRLALQGQETSLELIFGEKPLLTRVRPLRDKQGIILGGIVMVQDITEQKHTEEQLRQSEARYRLISEMTSDFVWAASITPQGEYKIDWATDAIETVTGYTLRELEAIGGWPSILPGEDLQIMIEGVQQIFAGNSAQGEFRIKRKDGQLRWLRFLTQPLLNEARQVNGIIGASKDITEQKQAEEQLRHSEARYRLISEMTSDFVWSVSTNGSGPTKLDWVTDAVESVTGYNASEFAQFNKIEGIIVQEDKPLFLALGQQFLEDKGKGKTHELDCRIKRKDGPIRWLHLVVRETTAGTGQVRGFVVVAKDITEQKQIEADKQALERQLQLIHKLESLGILAGGLAHDFNNLLSVILGNLSLVQTTLNAGSANWDVIGSLQEAEKASQRAISLTRQLLTFAKGGAPVRKMAQLGEIIEDSARFMVSGSRASLEFKIEPDLAAAEVDAGQLSQVIQNLVLNAVQAMPDGGKIGVTARNVVLHAEEVATLPGGSYVQISVQDEGSGISAENLAKIFDPFFTTKNFGSGLGLATVFSIIRQHEGHIEVQSEPGDGTSFTLYLPASSSTQPLSKEITPTSAQVLPVSSGRILIMDDEPSIRQTISRLLTHLGYSCEVAADGLEALQLYREAMANKLPFDAVILDLTVPNGMGGEEAVRQILKNDPKAKVIVSSGYSDDLVMANFRKYGFSGIASKPYRLKDLQQILDQVISEA